MSIGQNNTLTRAYADKDAASKDCYVVEPKDNELFLDIDSSEEFGVFVDLFLIFKQHMLSATYICRPSKSGGEKVHVTVTLPRPVKHEYERCFLQAALGSDRKREVLHWVAIEEGTHPKPVLFFEKIPLEGPPRPPVTPLIPF